jgi:hypothetical protein
MKKICCLAILLTLLFCQVAWAKEVTVDGTGASRDDAIRDALRAAVEQAVGILVDSQTVSNNNQIITDEIYTKSQGFVQDYHIIKEQNSGGLYTVSATVIVDTEPNSLLYTKLYQLKLIEVALRDPRIAVIIPEFYQSSALPSSSSGAMVIEHLRDAGFKHVIDARQLQNIQHDQILRAILDNDYDSAKILATTEKLDFVIVGEATSQYIGDLYNSGIHSSRAHIAAKVLKVDTGEIIAAHDFDASGADVTPAVSAKKALSACGDKVGEYMVKQLMEYASDPDKPVTIIIKRATFQKLNDIQQALKGVSGVKSVFLRSYNTGIAQIDVIYTGSPKVLADAMQNADGVSLDILGISNSSIDAMLK